MIEVAAPAGFEAGKHLIDEGGDGERDAAGAGEGEGNAQVFVVESRASMDGPRCSMNRLAARPPPSTRRMFAGSTPAFEPSTSASPIASMVRATTIWLQALTTWPAPLSPTWTTVLPSD